MDIDDPKYKNTHDKYEYKVESADGKTSTVHYMKEKSTGKKTDYKFKNHGNDGKTKKLSNSEKKQ